MPVNDWETGCIQMHSDSDRFSAQKKSQRGRAFGTNVHFFCVLKDSKTSTIADKNPGNNKNTAGQGWHAKLLTAQGTENPCPYRLTGINERGT